MGFEKGHPKFGGKKSGTHNKITRDVVGLLDSLGCNPLQGLATIAADETVAIAIRARCHAELAKYVHPQLKSMELSGPGGLPIEIRVGKPDLSKLTDDDLEQLDRITAKAHDPTGGSGGEGDPEFDAVRPPSVEGN